MVRKLLAASCLLAIAGCWNNQAPDPGQLAAWLRDNAPSYDALHAAAAQGPAQDVLHVRETTLAELTLGQSPERVKARYGAPNKRRVTGNGEWWDYNEVLKLAEEQGQHDVVGTLRLFFKKLPAKQPPDPNAPTMTLAQIQAWAPGGQQTRTLVRLLDPAARIERKYGKAQRTLGVGFTGGEVWVYPGANVAFVVSPPEPPEVDEGDPPGTPARIVAGTIVGL